MAEDKREPTRALDKASRVMDALAAENGLSPADIATPVISRDPPYTACWMDWSMWGGP